MKTVERERQAVSALSQENAQLCVQIAQLQTALRLEREKEKGAVSAALDVGVSSAPVAVAAVKNPILWANLLRPVRVPDP